MKLTLFFDIYCPLCVAEMEQLAKRNKKSLLNFEDINAADFGARYPEIDRHKANRILHGRYDDGKLIYGLDVTVQAWRLVDSHRWLVILRWPIIGLFADAVYWLFARYRYDISYFLTGQRRCEPCTKNGDKRCEL